MLSILLVLTILPSLSIAEEESISFDDVEDVRRQAFDALEVGVQECVPKELNHGGSGGRSALGPKANGKSGDCRTD